MLLLHGWPGSVVEFLAVIGPLSDPGPENPTAQAFDVVVPSLPGFGFSEAPKEAGWGLRAMASCFNALMTKVLKYEKYCVQGGDWGSMICRRMALDFGSVPTPPSALDKIRGFFSAEKLGGSGSRRKEERQQKLMSAAGGGSSSASAPASAPASASAASPEEGNAVGGGIVAIHQNMAVAAPRLSSPKTFLQVLNAPFAHVAPIFLTKDEAIGLRGLLIYQTKESGYFKIQSTKPMTLGYGLSDSPVAALAWVSVRKRRGRKEFWGCFFFLRFAPLSSPFDVASSLKTFPFSPFALAQLSRLFSFFFLLHYFSANKKQSTGKVPRLGRFRRRPIQESGRPHGPRPLFSRRHPSERMPLLVRKQSLLLREDLQGGGGRGRDQGDPGRVRDFFPLTFFFNFFRRRSHLSLPFFPISPPSPLPPLSTTATFASLPPSSTCPASSSGRREPGWPPGAT